MAGNSNIQKIFPLTSMQEGLLFHALNDASSAYFTQISHRVRGTVSPHLLRESLHLLARRHDVFRTAIVHERTERPIQVVLKDREIPCLWEDLSSLDEAGAQAHLRAFLDEDRRRGIDFTRDPLFRLAVFQLAKEEFVFVWSYHHIILDGWCLNIWAGEFTEMYRSLSHGETVDLPEPIPFGHYLQWLEAQDQSRPADYWRTHLRGYDTIAQLPEAPAPDAAPTPERPEIARRLISRDKTARLEALARDLKVTVNTVFQTVWGILLARYCGVDDVVYGNVVSGRPADIAGVERILGLFINTVPVRIRFDAATRFDDLARQTHLDAIESLACQHYPLSEVQAATDLKGNLIRHVVAFENFPLEGLGAEGPLRISDVDVIEQTNYDLDLEVELTGTLLIKAYFNPARYQPAYVDQMLGHLEYLLDQVMDRPDAPVGDLELVTAQERDRLFTVFNDAAVDLNNTLPINVAFERQVQAHGDAPAVIHQDQAWSFRTLNTEANQIAHVLAGLGVAPGDFVGVHLERGPGLVAAILGILKAGAVYVPLDTQNPPDRTEELIDNSGLRALISERSLCRALDVPPPVGILLLDEAGELLTSAGAAIRDRQDLDRAPGSDPVNRNAMDSWAYMLYTSGSTGKPKGAITRHNGAMNHLLAEYAALGLPDGFRFLQSASIASDISVWQILGPLLKGGAVVIIDKLDVLDYRAMLDITERHHVHIGEFVPSYLLGLVDFLENQGAAAPALPDLAWMMMVGEEVPVDLVNRWLRLFPACRVLNAYGPCEASDDIAQYVITAPLGESFTRVPIGRPLANMHIVVLDRHGKLLPAGVAGELCVSGVGVGAGYWNEPEKTAKSFVPNPFAEALGDTLYKTGDLARWLPDGNLEFLGRIDRQVKIAGYRVELGEVEAFLRAQSEVREAHVMAYQNGAGKSMLAFVTLHEPAIEPAGLEEELRKRCRVRLPGYMQPAHFSFVDSIPLNLSDKVDEKKLLNEFLRQSKPEGAAKRTPAFTSETEAVIHGIWEKLLGRSDFDLDDNFFEIGGDSLKAMRLVGRLNKAFDCSLSIRTIFANPSIRRLSREIDAGSAAHERISPVAVQETYPLSHAQKRLWFIHQLDEEQHHYNMTGAYMLSGPLEAPLFLDAYRALLDRHEILRTIFVTEGGEPRQKPLPNGPAFAMEYHDLSAGPDPLAEADAQARAAARTAFDLERGPLVNARLFRLGEEQYFLLFTMHHIITDGWSSEIVVRDLLRLYRHFRGLADAPATLPIQYKDYAAWHNQELTRPENKKWQAYWLERFRDEAPVLELATDYPRQMNRQAVGATIHFPVAAGLTRRLRELGNEHGASLFMVLLAAVKTLLYRYTGQEDIVVGAVTAGREHSDLEDQVGFYVNTLPMRTIFSGQKPFTALLAHVRQTTLGAFEHQQYPFDKLVEDLNIPRALNRSPLFDVMFVVQNINDEKEMFRLCPELTLKEHVFEQDLSKFDLTFETWEMGDALEISLEYNTGLFSRERMEALAGHLTHLLAGIAADARRPLAELPLLPDEERRHLLEDLAGGARPLPAPATIHGLFEQVAARYPGATAVVDETRSITYQELNEQANRLAACFREQFGVRHEDRVAVVMDKGIDFVVAMLAALKCGAAYLPLEARLPRERIKALAGQTRVALVLTDRQEIAEALREVAPAVVRGELRLEAFPTANPIVPEASGETLAYVMYTSGSTGRPKGVMIEHRGVVRLVRETNYIELTDQERILQTGSLSFDAATFEIWGALLNGGQVHLLDLFHLLDTPRLKQAIREKAITTMFFTTAWFNQLADQDASLFEPMRHVLFGGEQVSPRHVEKVRRQCPALRITHCYGPTENTTFSICGEVTGPIGATVPLGYPISNSTVYIVDRNGRLLPKGVPGEILLGGAGLSRGYIFDEERTRQQFIASPFVPGETLYRSGDLGRWLPDGRIEFIGRIDEQVKIRGFRVEPGEVAGALREAEGVREAVVLVHTTDRGEKVLVGYYVAEGAEQEEALKTFLRRRLPDYMVPSLLVAVPDIPLNKNGKADRSALPGLPELLARRAAIQEAPTNEWEEKLLGIWEEVLGSASIGVKDNFFEVGGSSLSATRVLARIQETFGLKINLADFFTHPDIASMAGVIAGRLADGRQPGPLTLREAAAGRNRAEGAPLSFAQERLWFIDRLQGSVPYHMPTVLRLRGPLDRAALAYALREIVNRHEVLRTVIREEKGQPCQELLPSDAWTLRLVDDPALRDDSRRAAFITTEVARPFDLTSDHPLRAVLVKLDEQDYLLLAVMHHIASDGWSGAILVDELAELYQAYVGRRPYELPKLPVQYADYAHWQRRRLEGEALTEQLAYWQDKLAGLDPLELPTDHPRPEIQSAAGATHTLTIDKELVEALRNLSQSEGATLFMTLLTAFQVLLHRYSGQEDICVGTTIAGRTEKEVEPLIGFFVNMLALRANLGGNPRFSELLRQVRQTTLEAYDRQEAPFEQVVGSLALERDLSRSPIFQVVFNLHNTPRESALRLGEIEVSDESFEDPTSIFDMDVDLVETAGGITLSVRYCRDLWEAATITRMMEHYRQLLAAAAADPACRIGEMPMLTEPELAQLIRFDGQGAYASFNAPAVDLNNNLPINLCFEDRAARCAAEPAVIHNETVWCYGELNEAANRLAALLTAHGVGEGHFVGVHMERGPWLVAALLGILKAGGAYVPLDVQNPWERTRDLIDDSELKVLITDDERLGQLPVPGGTGVICVDVCGAPNRERCALSDIRLSDRRDIDRAATANPPNRNRMDSLAYMLYTSGSTGKPKGALLRHDGAMNHILAEFDTLGLPDGFRFLQSASIASDISVWQFLGPILKGGATVIIDKFDLLDYARTAAILRRRHIHLAEFVPSYLLGLAEYLEKHPDAARLPDLAWMMLSGEEAPVALVNRWLQLFPNCQVINAYGPCEASDDIVQFTVSEPLPASTQRVPIGRPLPNLNVFVLDTYGQPVPVGVPGELAVSGAGVGAGYWKEPEKTARAFVPNPFPGTLGDTLYKTGDLARWRPDGNLEFLGRIDRQVKIAGFRMELGEVEAALLDRPGVAGVRVLACPTGGAHKALVAFVVPADDSAPETLEESLRQACRDALPAYMQPAFYCFLDALPLNLSDKVDEKKLLSLFTAPEPRERAVTAPVNELEAGLLAIWQTVLNRDVISTTDNFFAIGGHSLLAMRVISAIRVELSREVSIRDLFQYTTIAELAAHLGGQTAAETLPPVTPAERGERIPLSFAQERLWFIDQFQGSANYHIPAVLRLRGQLDRHALNYAIREAVNRHEVLRTVIRAENGQPYQEIMPENGWTLGYLPDGDTLPADQLREQIETFIRTPFDLAGDFMLRAQLIRMGTDDHLLVLVMHHIAADDWSIPILVDELAELYRAYNQRRAHELPRLDVQYADYAIWQRRYLAGRVLDHQLAYWKEQLRDLSPLELPTDFPRPTVQSVRGGSIDRKIDRQLYDSIKEFCRKEGVTSFMTLLAAFQVLLHRYSGQDDICVGTPVAGRTRQQVEPLIGFFVNMLAMRVDLSGNPSFAELLQRVKRTALDAYAHQEASFEQVVEAAAVERDLSRSPLFQVTFNLLTTPQEPDLDLGAVRITYEPLDSKTTLFDLDFDLVETEEGLTLTAGYCSDLFHPDTIDRMLGHYQRLLAAAVADPERPIGELDWLSDDETRQVLNGFNDTAIDYPAGKTIVSWFEEQVDRTPEAVAIVFEGQALTYRQLDERANQLAHFLRRNGVGRETLVALCLDRSLEMMIGLLGIQKAGGAYVPIDPQYPRDRIAYLLSDTEAGLVLTMAGCRDCIEAAEAATVICLDSDWGDIGREPVGRLQDPVRPDELAYVIYTSGSTGKPKGVTVEHGGVVNRLQWGQEQFDLQPSDIVLQKTTFCFDVSVYELFWPLLVGARLVLARPGGHKDSAYLREVIEREGITTIHFVPSMLEVFLQDVNPGDCRGLRRVFCSGEALKPAHIRSFREKLGGGLELHNLYGPTEASIEVAHWAVPSAVDGILSVPIGKPVANTQLYVLDPAGRPAPVGVPGELHIGGVQVARGYWKRPELTAERFIADPFRPGGRLYRTGDVVKWLPDGNLAYLGRLDHQVKIRGYRVELGEIETHLQQAPTVAQCVVVAAADAGGNQQLVAYVVPAAGEAFDRDAVLAYLRGRLPEYFLPAFFRELDELPLNHNGKVDRKALPAFRPTAAQAYAAPRTAAEMQLAALWQDLLRLERVGIHDNFFEIGGHSLLGMRLVSLIRRALGAEVTIQHLFQHPTIAGLATLLSGQARPPAIAAIERQERGDRFPLSYAQERLWFIDQLQGSVSYHMPVVLKLAGLLDRFALEYALREVVNRHEILRTVIVEENGRARQQVMPENGWRLTFEKRPDLQTEAALTDYVEQVVNRPFDLRADHPLRGALVALAEEEHLLVLVLHHIAADDWSISVLIDEVGELYRAYREHRAHDLPALPVQYGDYAIWQRRHLSGETLAAQLDYWKRRLDGVAPSELPTDFPRPEVQRPNGASVEARVDADLTRALARLAQQEGATLFMTLLAAFKVLLYRYSGQTDLCIGTPTAGRNQPETDALIGFFVNMLALRSDLDGNPHFTALLREIRRTTVEAYAHQDTPFGQIVEAIKADRDLSRSSVFQISFNLLNTPEKAGVELGDVTIAGHVAGPVTAQRDLSLTVAEGPDGLSLDLVYATDLFTADTAERMLRHYRNLLAAIAAEPEQPIDSFELLDDAEKQLLLEEYNQTEAAFPDDVTLVDMFRQQALATPEAIALEFPGVRLSYRELDEQSNRLARHLESKGVRPETLVMVCLDRSPDMVIGILAILKAGGAYVPVDPDYPDGRISFLLDDTGANTVVTTTRYEARFAGADRQIVCLDREQAAIGRRSPRFRASGLQASNLAYMIYTSGSTGQPKGVLVEHRSAVNEIVYYSRAFGYRADDRSLQMANYVFDASVDQIFMPLINGGTLVLAPRDILLNQQALTGYIREYRITHLHATPTLIRIIPPGAYQGLRRVLCGGEPCPAALAEAWSRYVRFYNKYGPTETTISSSYHAYDPERTGSGVLPIGKPIANTKYYILNAAQRLAPVGAIGELYIGGIGVTRGYHNREELTREKFIDSPFTPGERLYRTGDLCRWLPGGEVELIGRADGQVKIRGQRLELGEIENALQACEGIRQGVVTVGEDQHNEKILLAYVIPAAGYDKEELLAHLRGRLPRYMMPAGIVELPALPLTPSGKVDYRALPKPDRSAMVVSREYVAPRNAAEEQLIAIWQPLLGLERIGAHDNFFELGGHSLLATRLISAVREALQIELSIKDLFQNATVAELAAHIGKLSPAAALPAVTPQAREGRIPLSFAQERLWFIDRLQGSVPYHIPSVFRLRGALDEAALRAAFTEIVNRHEALRTLIREDDGQGYQVILPENTWQLTRIDNPALADPAALASLVTQCIRAPFDLSADLPLRVTLVRISDEEHVLILVLHHIASDGWSGALLVREWVERYRAHCENRPHRLPDLPVQYADYALWQRRHLAPEVLPRQLRYWQEQLAGVPALELPTDFPRPQTAGTAGAESALSIGEDTLAALQALSRENGATMFMTLLTAFNVLLHRYSGQDDLCVGTPIAGRTRREIESLIGFFVNTLAIRTVIRDNPSFLELLLQVKGAVLEAYANQDAPFEKVVEVVAPEKDLSRTPVFQVMFALQNTPSAEATVLGGLTIQPEVEPAETDAKFDLLFSLEERAGGLAVHATYRTDLFAAATIERLLAHFGQLLASIAADPRRSVAELPMLSPAEEAELLSRNTRRATGYPTTGTVAELFNQQVMATPDRVAVVFEGRRLSYRELHRRSNQWARHLLRKGVRPEAMVPVWMDRSEELLVVILGILKAGGVYTPIDPAYPRERVDDLLLDTGAKWVICQDPYAGQLADHPGVDVIDLDRVRTLVAEEADGEVPVPIQADSLAYLMYTSGSTGRPKGVMVEHRNIVSLVKGTDFISFSETDVFLATSSLSFDAAILDYWGALLHGGTLVLCPKEKLLDAALLRQVIHEHGVTKAFFTTSWFNQLADLDPALFRPLHDLMVGGEKISPLHVARVKAHCPDLRIGNGYGPTENTTFSTFYPIEVIPEKGDIPIGRPLNNREVYVLGSHRELCPVGAVGEVWLGGAGLARGYLNRPELTAEKFMDHPFRPGERLYRTGDLARWSPDGELLFIGRADKQVKVRGFRIELGEIETTLLQSGRVRQCAVVVREDAHRVKQLVAYVAPEGPFDRAAITGFLRGKLPEYMVPALMVELAALPLNNNGKLDQRALPEPGAADLTSDYAPPRDETERRLAAIWRELLAVERIGIHDNFFELGGHSLLATRAIARIQRACHTRIGLATLFTNPTIAALAHVINEQEKELVQPIPRVPDAPRHELSNAQRRFWIMDQMGEGRSAYNILTAYDIRGALDIPALDGAIRRVVERHEVLRTTFAEQDGLPYQQVHDAHRCPVGLEVLTLSTEEELRRETARFLDDERGCVFAFDRLPLIRFLLLTTPERHVLIVHLHHILADGWSMRVLQSELMRYYAHLRGQGGELPAPLPIQYRDYAAWQNRQLEAGAANPDEQYWLRKLAGLDSAADLPLDRPRPRIRQYQSKVTGFLLDAALSRRLTALGHSEDASVFITLQALVKVYLRRYLRRDDIVVGTPSAGRDHPDLESQIGLYMNSLVLRSNLTGANTFREALRIVKTDTLEAFEHQFYPFDLLVSKLNVRRDLSRNPLFDVMVYYFDDDPAPPSDPAGELEFRYLEEEESRGRSKYDLVFSFRRLDSGELEVEISYNPTLFDDESMHRLREAFREQMTALLTDPEQPLDNGAPAAPAGRRRLVLDDDMLD